MNNIYFYLPCQGISDDILPTNIDEFDINTYLKLRTRFSWTLQTYMRLKAANFPCTLSQDLPEEGIVLAFRGDLPLNLKPSQKLLIVCLLGDASLHPYSQLHVVQNPRQALVIKDSYYIPHWPQFRLISRDSKRGNRFENIAYFGSLSNLAPELQSTSWKEKLNSLGLNWTIMGPDKFYDYSNVDAIVAVRNFKKNDYLYKPASKLYNAWHAGIPAILGHKSAYRAERKSELDYIEVTSLDELLVSLKQLRDNPSLRLSMIANGHIRVQETSIENLTNRWKIFINNIANPVYEQWINSSNFTRWSFLKRRYFDLRIRGVKKRLESIKL